MHIHIQAYTPLKKILYSEQWEIIKYQKFISVVVIELSVRCLNTGKRQRTQTATTQSKATDTLPQQDDC